MFSTNRDNVDTSSFPILFDVNQDFAAQTQIRYHNSYTLEIENLNPVLNLNNNEREFMSNHPWQSPLFSSIENTQNTLEAEETNIVTLTDNVKTKPASNYIIYLKFDDNNAPKDYIFASYDFEKSYYLNYYDKMKNEKTPIFNMVNNLLKAMYGFTTDSSIFINKIYL